MPIGVSVVFTNCYDGVAGLSDTSYPQSTPGDN